MYSHRTNILLEPETYMKLKSLSKKEGKSTGELIRHAINIAYNVDKVQSTAELLKSMKALTKKVSLRDVTYQDLVQEGRKY